MRAAFLFFVFFLSGLAAELRVLVVPPGAVELFPDGQLRASEWDGAELTPLPGGGMLMAKQVGSRVWLAIVPDATYATYVDLFLEDGEGTVHNLHASLQWGQRTVSGSDWTDREPATEWGLPAHWLANRIAWAPGGREAAEVTRASFLPYEGHEFWISRSRYPGRSWRLRIEVRDFAGEKPDAVFPAESNRFDPRGWLVLRLE